MLLFRWWSHAALDNCRPISLLQTIQKKKQISTQFYSAICTARRRVARALIQIAVINLSSSALRRSSGAAPNCAGGRAQEHCGTEQCAGARASKWRPLIHTMVGGKVACETTYVNLLHFVNTVYDHALRNGVNNDVQLNTERKHSRKWRWAIDLL